MILSWSLFQVCHGWLEAHRPPLSNSQNWGKILSRIESAMDFSPSASESWVFQHHEHGRPLVLVFPAFYFDSQIRVRSQRWRFSRCSVRGWSVQKDPFSPPFPGLVSTESCKRVLTGHFSADTGRRTQSHFATFAFVFWVVFLRWFIGFICCECWLLNSLRTD